MPQAAPEEPAAAVPPAAVPPAAVPPAAEPAEAKNGPAKPPGRPTCFRWMAKSWERSWENVKHLGNSWENVKKTIGKSRKISEKLGIEWIDLLRNGAWWMGNIMGK